MTAKHDDHCDYLELGPMLDASTKPCNCGVAGEKLYYVEDTRTTVGNCILWWAKDCNGYTCHLDKAHVFTAYEVATRLHRDTDRPWLKSDVDKAASLQVDFQRLQRITEAGQ